MTSNRTNSEANSLGNVSTAVIYHRRKDKVYSTNKTGYRGIYWDKADRKYRVRLRIRNKRYYLGVYSVLEEAVTALRVGERELRMAIYGGDEKVTCSHCSGRGWVLEALSNDNGSGNTTPPMPSPDSGEGKEK